MTANLGAVDKVALSNAAIYGLKEDLKLRGQEYSWAGSILAIGALFGIWPSMYLVHKLPSAKYLACCSVIWSAIALITPATRNWGGLMALRFLMGKSNAMDEAEKTLRSLGALEAIIVPSISIIIAGFYKKSEQPARNALVFASASSIHNGFLSWALSHIPASAPLSVWQYIYIVNGSLSGPFNSWRFSDLTDRLHLTRLVPFHSVVPSRHAYERQIPRRSTEIPHRPAPRREPDWYCQQAMEVVPGSRSSL